MREEVRSKLEQMEFGELRQLIDDCLAYNSSAENKDLITFEVNEISGFIDVLESKLPPPKHEVKPPPPPQEPPKSRLLSLAEKAKEDWIIQAERKGSVTVHQVKAERGLPIRFDYSTSKNRKKLHIRMNLFGVDRRHDVPFNSAILEDHERYQWELKAYAAKLTAYHKMSVSPPRTISTKQSTKQKIVNRLRRDLAERRNGIGRFKKLYWKLLPPGDDPIGRIRLYFERTGAKSAAIIDYNKIRKVLTLKPTEVYSGVDEFDGYLVFYFERQRKAVLDCPRTGNAIYVFGEDWRELSKLSKSELLNFFPSSTIRIIHRGEWFVRLKDALWLYSTLSTSSHPF